MTGRERIMAVLSGSQVDRPPWVPYVGVHGGKLINCTAKEYMSNSESLLKGLRAVKEIYKPDGIVAVFDLQLEAEVLGCQLKWYDDSPPSVVSHPLAEDNHVPSFNPEMMEAKGNRIDAVLSAVEALKRDEAKDAALYGLICGPMTLATHLRGESFMMDIILNEGYVKELLNFTSKVTAYMAERYLASGADIIAVVDPMISQVSPGHLSKLMHHNLKDIFIQIRKQGGKSALFVCGSVDKHLPTMCRTLPDIISVDEHTDYSAAKIILKAYGVVPSGNLPVSTLLLHGTTKENVTYIKEALSTSSEGIVASGCDIPYDTPIENIISIGEYIRSSL